MFTPNFRYTHKIVNNLTAIAKARAVILNAPLIPKWEVSLRREALLRSAHSSTAIEGNPLTLEQVSELAAGRDIMVRRKDKKEVLNYLEALEKIPEFAERKPFKFSDLLELHKLVTRDTLENPADEGSLRNQQVAVVNRATGQIIFMPPPTDRVGALVEEFLEWFNSEEVNEIDPVIEAGLAHYELVRIHPFVDGNGRTARVMASIVLFKRAFDIKRFFALDDYYDKDRRAYYTALKTVDQDRLDLTGWLEYFTEGVAVSLKAVEDKVIGLSQDIKFLKQRGQIALTERQMKIVEMLLQNEKLTVGQVKDLFGFSRQMALKEMTKLVELGVVRSKGRGRGAYYELA
ncbi:MAG TPA: Fic family protein [Candidatus Saccharicenans sp.]|nr:Fic family protein [Candidatus Saccharicenans sp.]